MFTFLNKNSNDYSFLSRKWGVVSTELKTSNNPYQCHHQYSLPKYGWTETETKILKSGSDISIDLNNTHGNSLRGWSMSRKDKSSYSEYDGGVFSEVVLYITGYGWASVKSTVDKTTRFIKYLPTNSRKQLIKLIYLYELKDEKNFWSFERLFFRLVERFNFKFHGFGYETYYQFDYIKPTFQLNKDRNKKINKIFKLFKK